MSSDAVATIKEKVLDQVSRLSSYLEVLQGYDPKYFLA